MFQNVSEPIQMQKAFSCPCCKFKTLFGRGHIELRPVCFWEDDGQDEQDAEQVRGGPSGVLSLRNAQENFRAFGASEECFIAKVRKPVPEEL
jgi:cysteine-rich CPCC protein